MAKKKQKQKNLKQVIKREKKPSRFVLPEHVSSWILGVIMFLIAIILTFSFFNLAGLAGRILINTFSFLMGKAVFFTPLLFIFGGLVFFHLKYKNKWPVFLAIFILILGITGIFGSLDLSYKQGGWLGFILSWPLIHFFGYWVALIIFSAMIIVGGVVLWQLAVLRREKAISEEKITIKPKKLFIRRIFGPKFKIKEVGPEITEKPFQEESKPALALGLKTKPVFELKSRLSGNDYQLPPPDLLESDRGRPTPRDTRLNSTVIKRTLQNFGINVEMSEVNVGPTVTQYTFKPAEGVKLSRITTLTNDLSLALAAHPLRIEAPIPGKSLVGVEVPNETRAIIRLKSLVENPVFQDSSFLTFALGRDVAGVPVYADLAKMPHLLVAGSTGTGKTVCLNSIILSLLFHPNSPEILRLILIDPKRVEFSVYEKLPHLLCPVIFDAQRAINILKWLNEEMERRFDVLSAAGEKDIDAYNETVFRDQDFDSTQDSEILPYIVLIIDELADLMTARGREVEAGIVRLAQMARAVGIHLIVATQRPSVEVITGLIKANITSRIAFQVASQIDSRTVFDMAGAEKLLGLGDLLFVSSEISKPKRVQGSYISEKDIKKVTNFIISRWDEGLPGEKAISKDELSKSVERGMEETEDKGLGTSFFGEDPLYEEAKRIVVEAGKASASLLQRRLRIGYARAARLIDILEERGVVGPGEGAKPREIYLGTQGED